VDYIQKRNALIDAVTSADVKRAAKRIFNPRAMTIVIGGTPETQRASKSPIPGEAHPAHH